MNEFSEEGMEPRKVEALGRMSELIGEAIEKLNLAVLIGELARFEKAGEAGLVPVDKLKQMLEPLQDFQIKAKTRYRAGIVEMLMPVKDV